VQEVFFETKRKEKHVERNII